MIYFTNASKMTVNLFLILSLSFLAYSVGNHLCGPDSCNSLENVKKCNNVQYCISEVWVNKVSSEPKDNMCNICMEMVKEARDTLQSNETQEEIREVLEGSCKLMGFEPAVKMCMKLADEFEVELVQMLLSQMDPELICTTAKLCFNNELLQKQLKSYECVTCQKFVTSAAEVVIKSPETDLMNQFINVCRSMSSYSDSCTFYLLQDPISIMNQTKAALLNQPCEHANLCPLGATPPVVETISEDSTWQESKKKFCNLCPAMMGYLHSLMDRLGTEKNLKLWMENLCSSVSLPKHVCKKFVQDHHNLLQSYFDSNVGYSYICTYGLGLCGKESEPAPIWPLLPVSKSSKKVLENGETLFQTKKPLSVKVVHEKPHKSNRIALSLGDPIADPFRILPLTQIMVPDAGKCLACSKVFSVISQYINTHEEYVDSILNSTCQKATNFDECMTFSKNYGHLFKDAGNLSADKVCPLLVPFCDVKISEQALLGNPVPEQSCRFCVDTFDSLTLNNPKIEAAEAQVEKDLKKMCETIPKNAQSLCNQMAEGYFKGMIASVTSDMGSIDTCGYLKLCDLKQISELRNDLHPAKKNNYCESCLLVTQTIYDKMESESGKKDFKEILKSLCGELPSSTKSTCYLLIDVYSEELVDMLVNYLSPEVICQKFHFCTKSSIQTTSVVSKNTIFDKISCNFCTTAMNIVVNQLEDNKTEESIKKALSQICVYMPEEVKDTCNSLISQYMDDIMDMILADFNATEICIYLKMCSPKVENYGKKHASSLGFSVATNEIWRKYSPQGACHFCRILEKSMAVTGHEEKGAEEMLGLLADVCLMDSSKVYGNCNEKFTKEIVPFGKRALLKMSNICSEMEICTDEEAGKVKVDDRLISQIKKAVEECAMCENIVGIVSRHLKGNLETYDFAGNATRFCRTVPKDKIKMCASMLTSYAPSVVNLLTLMKVKENEVCSELKLCEKSTQTKINIPVTSIEQNGLNNLDQSGECLKGPSFWCANLTNAKKCGTVLHCKEMVWKKKKF